MRILHTIRHSCQHRKHVGAALRGRPIGLIASYRRFQRSVQMQVINSRISEISKARVATEGYPYNLRALVSRPF